MPKLGIYSKILDCVFFLYKSREDAEIGVPQGATGFLVAVPSKQLPGRFHIHGITNSHAIASNPTPCIRINSDNGKPEIFNLEPTEWIFNTGSYDIAVTPPLVIPENLHKLVYLDMDSFFLTAEKEREDEIGPADDVFMVGRFIDYAGTETIEPALRFGHISIMNAQVKQNTGFIGRSIIVDMHSRSGFSGSPVFVYRTLGSHFIEEALPGQVLMGGGHYMKLLGIHWGQFPENWDLKDNLCERSGAKSSLVTEGAYVKGFSGMTLVIPSACIEEVLFFPEVQETRNELNCIPCLF